MLRDDVSIVGTGSAGCGRASWWSDDRARQVLLLEAGYAYLPDHYPDVLVDADPCGGGPEDD
jgi:choline dehydrogenase-like flavoprotein